MATNPEHIITDNPNVVPVSRDLAYEIAAVSAAILDAREEKTRIAKKLNADIKSLEKRQRELIEEIRSGGTQLAINFGSRVESERSLASNAPSDDEEPEEEEGEEDPAEEDEDAGEATH